MNFRKVLLISLAAFIIIPFLGFDQIMAADRTSGKLYGNKLMTADTNNRPVKAFIRVKDNNGGTTQVYQNNNDNGKRQKLSEVRRKPLSSRIIEAILDYEDYTHIFRLYENKE